MSDRGKLILFGGVEILFVASIDLFGTGREQEIFVWCPWCLGICLFCGREILEILITAVIVQ